MKVLHTHYKLAVTYRSNLYLPQARTLNILTIHSTPPDHARLQALSK